MQVRKLCPTEIVSFTDYSDYERKLPEYTY